MATKRPSALIDGPLTIGLPPAVNNLIRRPGGADTDEDPAEVDCVLGGVGGDRDESPVPADCRPAEGAAEVVLAGAIDAGLLRCPGRPVVDEDASIAPEVSTRRGTLDLAPGDDTSVRADRRRRILEVAVRGGLDYGDVIAPQRPPSVESQLDTDIPRADWWGHLHVEQREGELLARAKWSEYGAEVGVRAAVEAHGELRTVIGLERARPAPRRRTTGRKRLGFPRADSSICTDPTGTSRSGLRGLERGMAR